MRDDRTSLAGIMQDAYSAKRWQLSRGAVKDLQVQAGRPESVSRACSQFTYRGESGPENGAE